MPPDIAAFLHVDVVSGATKNDYALHRRPAAQCVVVLTDDAIAAARCDPIATLNVKS